MLFLDSPLPSMSFSTHGLDKTKIRAHIIETKTGRERSWKFDHQTEQQNSDKMGEFKNGIFINKCFFYHFQVHF